MLSVRDVFKFFISDVRGQLLYGVNAPLHFQLLYVNPSSVRLHTAYVGRFFPASCATVPPTVARKSQTLWSNVKGTVCSGDWDVHTVPLSDILPYQLATKKLQTGLSWRAVGEYDRMLEIIEIKGEADGCKSIDDLDRRYDRLDMLAREVELHRRLKTRKELGVASFREKGGINVALGRSGEVIKLEGGSHRLAIATHFRLPVVPVCVRLVHEDFVKSGGFRKLLAASRVCSPAYEISQEKIAAE